MKLASRLFIPSLLSILILTSFLCESVWADPPQINSMSYQLWLRKQIEERFQPVFDLKKQKYSSDQKELMQWADSEFEKRSIALRASLFEIGQQIAAPDEAAKAIPLLRPPPSPRKDKENSLEPLAEYKQRISDYEATVAQVEADRRRYIVEKGFDFETKRLQAQIRDKSADVMSRFAAAVTDHELHLHYSEIMGPGHDTREEPNYGEMLHDLFLTGDSSSKTYLLSHLDWEPLQSALQSSKKFLWEAENSINGSDSTVRVTAFEKLTAEQILDVPNPTAEFQNHVAFLLPTSTKAQEVILGWSTKHPSRLTDPEARKTAIKFFSNPLNTPDQASFAAMRLGIVLGDKPGEFQKVVERRVNDHQAALRVLLASPSEVRPSIDFLFLATLAEMERPQYQATFFSKLAQLAADPKMTGRLIRVAQSLKVSEYRTSAAEKFVEAIIVSGDRKDPYWSPFIQTLGESTNPYFRQLANPFLVAKKEEDVNDQVDWAKADPSGLRLLRLAVATNDTDVFKATADAIRNFKGKGPRGESFNLDRRIILAALSPDFSDQMIELTPVFLSDPKALKEESLQQWKKAILSPDPKIRSRAFKLVRELGDYVSDETRESLADSVIDYFRKADPKKQNIDEALQALQKLGPLSDLNHDFMVSFAKKHPRFLFNAIRVSHEHNLFFMKDFVREAHPVTRIKNFCAPYVEQVAQYGKQIAKTVRARGAQAIKDFQRRVASTARRVQKPTVPVIVHEGAD